MKKLNKMKSVKRQADRSIRCDDDDGDVDDYGNRRTLQGLCELVGRGWWLVGCYI